MFDTINGYSGQVNNWLFDYTEIVKLRNSRELATLIETDEKIEGSGSWIDLYHAELSYFDNDTLFEYKLKEWNTNTNSWNSQLFGL